VINRLKIGWKTYEVFEKAVDDDLISGGDRCYGRIVYGDQQIYINSEYPETQKTTTLIHEALHAIDDAYDIGLEENQVIRVGNGIAALISDNPALLDELKILCKSTSE
jgi:hypothetical protein